MDFDGPLRALLLQRAVPGDPLSTVTDDDRATEIFCSVFRRLHQGSFTGTHQSISEHFSAIARYQQMRVATGGPLPLWWVDRAADYLTNLASSNGETELLHGDLHHDNILHDGGEWVVIDPKGIIGDPHFDVIQYLLNYPGRGGDPEAVLARRMAMMTEQLTLDAQRIAMWGIAKGILDACWALEDGADWRSGLHTAERFERWLAQSGHSKG